LKYEQSQKVLHATRYEKQIDMTKERPILFSGPMVKAILSGAKSQTRRIMKPQPGSQFDPQNCGVATVYCPTKVDDENEDYKSPYGSPGDRLWVRETFKTVPVGRHVVYRVDEPQTKAQKTDHAFGPWKPSIFMPRWASRITLEITSVRVEQLRDISAAEAEKEGCGCGVNDATGGPVARYCVLWESINGAGSWKANPWVWVISFKRV